MSTARSLTKVEFEFLVKSDVRGSHPLLHEEREWWAGNSRVGTVIRDKVDNDWSFVALAQNPNGGWQCYASAVSLPSIEEARERLQKSFTTVLASGWWK